MDKHFDNISVEVSMSKNNVLTKIPDRKGTVKEYISDGDYYIKVIGKLTKDIVLIDEFLMPFAIEGCLIIDYLVSITHQHFIVNMISKKEVFPLDIEKQIMK